MTWWLYHVLLLIQNGRFCPKRWPVLISKTMINQWMKCVCSPNFQTKSNRDFDGANMMHVSTAGRMPRILFGTSTFGRLWPLKSLVMWPRLRACPVFGWPCEKRLMIRPFQNTIHVCDEGFSVHRGSPSPDPQASKPKPKPKHLTAGCSGSFRVEAMEQAKTWRVVRAQALVELDSYLAPRPVAANPLQDA